ncbi:MAG: cell division regulator GpsB [Thomasclavelia sp.]|nr:cell division regulator GpsB [Thomasclavelia sp.]
MNTKVTLSPKKILNKEFKVDFKGYNADEVDHYLDQIVADYEAFATLLNASYEKVEQLEKQLSKEKETVLKLQKEAALQDDNIHALEENASSNVDILKRLSLLEKVVFSKNSNF